MVLFYVLGEDVSAEGVAGGEIRLHLHDGGFARARVAVGGKGGGTAGVVLVGVLVVHGLDDTGYGVTVGDVIILKLLLSPLEGLVGIYAKAVHPVDDARDVVVATSLLVSNSLVIDELSCGGKQSSKERIAC